MLPFTVFTPTFNRAHSLPRVFESLLRQSPIFEWLVVDDGSTDDTAALLQRLADAAPFDLRVVRQPNGGKHRAHNTALQHARGTLTVSLDSDDALAPNALEILWREWCAIPEQARACFAGIIGHSSDPDGRLVGCRLGSPHLDGRWFELVAAGRIVGEKLPCYRSDILRAFPFPAQAGSTAYLPEGVVWVRIGMQYPVRCIDQVVRIYHRDTADTTAVMNRYAKRASNAWGRMYYAMTVLNLSARYWPRFNSVFLKTAAGYVRDALHAGYLPSRQFLNLEGLVPRVWWLAAFPVGIMAWLVDRSKELGADARRRTGRVNPG